LAAAAGLPDAESVLELVERVVGDRRLLTAQVEFFVRAVLDEDPEPAG
jgi:hypothetical protein